VELEIDGGRIQLSLISSKPLEEALKTARARMLLRQSIQRNRSSWFHLVNEQQTSRQVVVQNIHVYAVLVKIKLAGKGQSAPERIV
jgi:hypothetical protein